LERAEADPAQVIALCKGDEDDEQVDKVKVDDEIEKRDPAIDLEDAGYRIVSLFRGGKD
jgi:hypothetical protein